VEVAGCRFIENESDLGGAVFASGAALTVRNCEFVRNKAINSGDFGEGGAIELRQSQATVERSKFLGNVADDDIGTNGFGGAIDVFESLAGITNCVFAGNTAFRGSAVVTWGFDNDSYALVTFGTLSDNPSGHGALYGIDAVGGFMDSFNSIFVSSYPNVPGVPPSYSDWLGSGGYPAFGIIDADPQFVSNPSPGADGIWGTGDDYYGDLHLKRTSPCIDAGSANGLDANGDPLPAAPATDLDGNLRIVGAAPDMGAYEWAPVQLGFEALTRRPGEIGLTVNIKNTGGVFLREVLVTQATLGGVQTVKPLPIVIRGGIAAAATAKARIVFPESVGPPGAIRTLHVTVTWKTGSYSLDTQIVLP
jgi:hypothetical protein